MSKIVYRPGDVLSVMFDGTVYQCVVQSHEVSEPNPDTGEATITYTTRLGNTFTDDQIVDDDALSPSWK